MGNIGIAAKIGITFRFSMMVIAGIIDLLNQHHAGIIGNTAKIVISGRISIMVMAGIIGITAKIDISRGIGIGSSHTPKL